MQKSKTHRVCTGCGNLYTTIVYQDDKPSQVFILLGKSGGCTASYTSAIAGLISKVLELGGNMDDINHLLCGIMCSSPTYDDGELITSCADAIARCIKK